MTQTNDQPRPRCGWCGDDPLYQRYHDEEWGLAVYDDTRLFELLLLEGAQAGLSWITVLRKREHYRAAFDGFDAQKIARYNASKHAELLRNPRIIRNKLKVAGFTQNAQAYLNIIEQGESFSSFIWQFTDGNIIQNEWSTLADVPSSTPESEIMSKALKKKGFTFVGPTICYAFMQATGMVNDHVTSCYRHRELQV